MKKKKRPGAITRRLFVNIILVVLGISALILLSNSLLLRPLYYYSMKNTLLKALNEIASVDFSTDSDVWTEQLNSLTAGQPYDIVVRNGNDMLYSSSVEYGLRPKPARAAQEGPGTEQGQTEGSVTLPGTAVTDSKTPPDSTEGRFYFFRNTDELEALGGGAYYGAVSGRSGIEMMVCAKELDGGASILLTQPVEPVNQSVWQANILLAGCALLAVGISAVIALRLSRRFTLPITRIQSAVGSIAALDFREKCNINTGDELQSLGEDVNRLSDKLKSALDTLKLQNEQLEKDIAAQRQFISNASHELRTPLALIKGYADEINAGFAPDEGQKDAYAGIIAEEAAKMSRLLHEMLELTRMESGMAALRCEKLSVRDSIRTFLDKYDGFISANGLKITLKMEEDAQGFFDPVRFEQVLANYISNAARYGDENKRVEITAQTMEYCIRVSVFNTGKPIPPEIVGSLWDGFFKADVARTRTEDSYGLGLSVVKAIQTAAGKGYGATNSQGGVTFWFDVARLNA